LRGAPGLLRLLRGDERDRLAVVADAVTSEHGLVGELEAVGLRAGHVLVREHCVDAGHLQRLAEVDFEDPRVRVRAAQRMAPEHPGRGEVARVCELAGDLRDRIDALDALADTPELEPARCRAHAREAANLTASKIFA